ncbi:MAG TPA: hypothetical protein VIY51_09010 [Xanthobacteraceae bacterium]
MRNVSGAIEFIVKGFHREEESLGRHCGGGHLTHDESGPAHEKDTYLQLNRAEELWRKLHELFALRRICKS